MPNLACLESLKNWVSKILPSSSLVEADGFRGSLACVGGLKVAHLVLSDLQLSQDRGKVSLALRIKLHGAAHHKHTFVVPLINDLSAVVDNEGVIVEVHHVPVISLSHAIVFANHLHVTGLGFVCLAFGDNCGPDLSLVDSSEAEERVLVDLAVFDLIGHQLAVVAIVKWVESFDDVPEAVELGVVDIVDCASGLAVGSVVDRIRRRQSDTLMVDIEALEQ